MSETFDPKQALALCETAGKAASGWRGRFFYDAERGDLGYIADACDRKECDCEQKLNSDGDQDCSVSLGAVECEVDDCGADIAAMLNAVAPLSTALPMAARRVIELERDAEAQASESLRAHAEYKQRRNDQFAAYELAHRATISYLLDRAEQYSNSSGYRAAFGEIVGGIAKREHIDNAVAGEYDDLRESVDRLVGQRRESVELISASSHKHAVKAITAERDSARAEVERLTNERDAYRAGLADLFALVSNGYEVTGEFRHRLRDLLKNGPAPREAGIE